MSMKVKSLKDSIKKTGLASTTGLKKSELIRLRHKLKVYEEPIQKTEEKPVDECKTVKFDGKTINLTDEQHKIVVAEKDSHYKVIACAGSGKTTTILCRIKYLIDSGVKPYQILLTTFNVDAAENMKIKMDELFGFKTNIYVGTIDALAYRFYNAYFKRPDFIGVSEYCSEFLKFLREDSDNNNKLRNRFEYVFFDEFQDCNDVQFEIIKEFAKTSRVTVIGDDAQNIYQWRGSNMDFILNFESYMNTVYNEKVYPDDPKALGCKIMTLKKNFRSTPEIISMANNSIRNNTDQIPKDMIAVNKSYARLPKIYRYSNEEEQAEYTLAYIVRYIKNNIKQEQIAVLARNNYSIKYVEEVIEKYNLKIKKKEEESDVINLVNKEPCINYVALIADDTRDTKPKIMKDHITLTTIHKSKGLEWDVVFILSCNDDKFPSETTPVKIQEDRRLFYVAVTRAKRYLNLSFTSKTISRFIGELDKNLYVFDKPDPSMFKYKDDRNIKFKNGVTQLIEMLEPKDIEHMRKVGLLPSIIPHTYKVHNEHTYSDYIDKYYLQADYGTYIDRYITRQLGLNVPGCGGLIDSVANRVLNTITLDKSLIDMFTCYNYNIQRKIDMFYNLTPQSVLKMIDRAPKDPSYIKKIDPLHYKQMIHLITVLVHRAKELKIYPSQLFVTQSNYMPYQYKNKFENSYQNYRKQNSSEDKEIRRDIYNVSLCQNVYDGRRRLLYKECFDEFDTDVELYKDIDEWTSTFRHRKILVKTCLIDKNIGICGEADMIDITDIKDPSKSTEETNRIDSGKIIDFKCSLNSEYKLEWILQLMMYSALYKHVYSKIINKLSIYNPLKGTVTDIDLEDWDMHEELLMYMDQIRTTRMNEK